MFSVFMSYNYINYSSCVGDVYLLLVFSVLMSCNFINYTSGVGGVYL